MDWNDDGLLDIIVGDRNGYINYFRRTANLDATLTTEPDIQAGGTTIDVGYSSAPVVVDWNEDGLKDLVVGRESNSPGSVMLYLNSGSVGDPVFTTASYIQSGGSNIALYRSCPEVHDMNQDGKKDLIIGENNGYLYYYENVGTNASPVFSGSVRLESDGTPIDIYYGARLCVDDWNQDGYPDMLVSDYDGWVYQYLAYPTGIEDEPETEIPPSGIMMTLLGPNPSSGPIGISLSLENPASDVSLLVYGMDGRCVGTLHDGALGAGVHQFDDVASACPPGVYLVHCQSGEVALTQRLVVVP